MKVIIFFNVAPILRPVFLKESFHSDLFLAIVSNPYIILLNILSTLWGGYVFFSFIHHVSDNRDKVFACMKTYTFFSLAFTQSHKVNYKILGCLYQYIVFDPLIIFLRFKVTVCVCVCVCVCREGHRQEEWKHSECHTSAPTSVVQRNWIRGLLLKLIVCVQDRELIKQNPGGQMSSHVSY